MDERQQQLAREFVQNERLYAFIKQHLLSFGKIKDDDCSDADLGARYRMKQELQKELELKFKQLELVE